MQRLGAGVERCADHCLDIEVRPSADAVQRDGLVGQTDVERVRIVLRVDRDRADAKFARGASHSDGDLASIGDQELGR